MHTENNNFRICGIFSQKTILLEISLDLEKLQKNL